MVTNANDTLLSKRQLLIGTVGDSSFSRAGFERVAFEFAYCTLRTEPERNPEPYCASTTLSDSDGPIT